MFGTWFRRTPYLLVITSTLLMLAYIPSSTLKSAFSSMGCAGVPAAVWRGALLPAEPHGEGAGAMEAGARAAAGSSALRMPGGACDPWPRREDRSEWRQSSHRGDLPRDGRRHVQLSQRRLEPGPHSRYSFSTERILQTQFRTGRAMFHTQPSLRE